jgi:hypothetical protein
MALFKENYTNQFGVNTQYWKITKVSVDLTNKFCEVELSGFYNKETRDANKEPLERRKVRANWTPERFDEYFGASIMENYSIYVKAYEYAKTIPFFADCIDI